MKTIKQWLAELPEPYKTKSINNVKESLEKTEPSLFAALNNFTWGDTPEGHKYWEIVYKYHWQTAIK